MLIAEDHALIVEGLKSLLEANGHQVFHAPEEKSLMFLLANERIDVLIQDIRYGKVDARTFIPSIREQFPEVKIVVLTSLDDSASIHSILATNIQGYIIKTEPSSLILEAVETVFSGNTYLSPEVQSVLAGQKIQPPEIKLSEREKSRAGNLIARFGSLSVGGSADNPKPALLLLLAFSPESLALRILLTY